MKNLKIKAGIAATVLTAALVAGPTLAWFTDAAEVEPATFKAGTVQIDADRELEGPAGDLYYEDIPYDVVDFLQGSGIKEDDRKVTPGDTQAVYDKISSRTAPGAKPPVENFFTLGKSGGYVVVELSRTLPAQDKIRVIECSWGSANPVEKANLSVSANGIDWTFVKEIKSSEDPNGDQHESQIEIPENLEVRYIRLVDNTGSSQSDGYDIDYLGVIVLDEGNWNPGDKNKIAYTVENAGTKNIQLRAIISGEWDDPDLSAENVTFTIAEGSDWIQDPDDSHVFYYDGILSGNYDGKTPGSASLYLTVALDGEGTGNKYQGKKFVLTPIFQAIQASHSSEAEAGGWTWDDFENYN